MASLYDVRKVMSVIAKSAIPVDRWVATSRGCRFVLTTSIPITICTDTIAAAKSAVFFAGVPFLTMYAAVV